MHIIFDLECGSISDELYLHSEGHMLFCVQQFSYSHCHNFFLKWCFQDHNFVIFWFYFNLSFWEKGIDLFRKLKQEFRVSITPSSSKRFLIPNTRSTFSCISKTNVKISNLWLWTVIITGMTNSTPTYCPLPT